ncbi:hypothetical protein NPIL_440851 [Nephila pilipes]|uniref:Transposase n=1 Tax=Nephila pilipes TaxID=299642 RepID=A0A8X6P3L4_NEPPI|nr:hypothetical protein NPIL_440851 [Nephila pilipes]
MSNITSSHVMIWGFMGYNGVENLQLVDEKMTALTYIDMLHHYLKVSVRRFELEETLIFQKDQDPMHMHTLSLPLKPKSGFSDIFPEALCITPL